MAAMMLKLSCVGLLRLHLQWTAFSSCATEGQAERTERHTTRLWSDQGADEDNHVKYTDPHDEDVDDDNSTIEREGMDQTASKDHHSSHRSAGNHLLTEASLQDEEETPPQICSVSNRQDRAFCQLTISITSKTAGVLMYVFQFNDETTWKDVQDAVSVRWGLTPADWCADESRSGGLIAHIRNEERNVEAPVCPQQTDKLVQDLHQGDGYSMNLRGQLKGGVAHGVVASGKEWQDNYDFVVNVRFEGSDHCTGVIAGRYVLTAAHCTVDAERQEMLEASKFEVITADGKKRTVDKVTMNPAYHGYLRSRTNEGDVAMLTLAKSDWYRGKRVPVLRGEELQEGEELVFAGFGRNENRTSDGQLRITSNAVMKVGPCKGKHLGSDGMVCVGSGESSSTGSCGGDSGGPWFYVRQEDNAVILAGTTSYGFDGKCGYVSKKTGIIPTYAVADWLVTFPFSSFSWFNLRSRYEFVMSQINGQPKRFITAITSSKKNGFQLSMCHMTHQRGFAQSSNIYHWDDTEAYISEYWDRDFQLVSLKFVDTKDKKKKWAAIMEKGAGVSESSWHTRSSLAKFEKAIKELPENEVIIDVSYGDGKWAMVTAKTEELTEQTHVTSKRWEDIADFIRNEWRNHGRTITSVARGGKGFMGMGGGGTYFVVMSKTKHIEMQSYGWKNSEDEVRQYVAEQSSCNPDDSNVFCRITALFDDSAKSDTPYLVVMSQVTAGSKLFDPTVRKPDCVFGIMTKY